MVQSSIHRRYKAWSRTIVFSFLAAAVLAGISTACEARQLDEHPSPPPIDKQVGQDALARQHVVATFHTDVLDKMERTINETIASGGIPGGVLLIERNNIDFVGTYGYRALVPQREMMTRDTIFNIASLTKVVGFKLFFHEDKPSMMTPKQVMGMEPVNKSRIKEPPRYINYQ